MFYIHNPGLDSETQNTLTESVHLGIDQSIGGHISMERIQVFGIHFQVFVSHVRIFYLDLFEILRRKKDTTLSNFLEIVRLAWRLAALNDQCLHHTSR